MDQAVPVAAAGSGRRAVPEAVSGGRRIAKLPLAVRAEMASAVAVAAPADSLVATVVTKPNAVAAGGAVVVAVTVRRNRRADAGVARDVVEV